MSTASVNLLQQSREQFSEDKERKFAIEPAPAFRGPDVPHAGCDGLETARLSGHLADDHERRYLDEC